MVLGRNSYQLSEFPVIDLISMTTWPRKSSDSRRSLSLSLDLRSSSSSQSRISMHSRAESTFNRVNSCRKTSFILKQRWLRIGGQPSEPRKPVTLACSLPTSADNRFQIIFEIIYNIRWLLQCYFKSLLMDFKLKFNRKYLS